MKETNYHLEYTLKLLEAQVLNIKNQLPAAQDKQLLIDEKISHDLSIKLLKFCIKNQIDPNARVIDISTIDGQHGFSEFRLVVDNESDDPQHWQEIKEINGVEARFSYCDKILKL